MLAKSAFLGIFAMLWIAGLQTGAAAASMDLVVRLPNDVRMNFVHLPTPPSPAQWGIYREYYFAKTEMTVEQWNALPGGGAVHSAGAYAAAMSRSETADKLKQLEQYLSATGQGDFEAVLPDWNRWNYAFTLRHALLIGNMDAGLEEWSSHFWNQVHLCAGPEPSRCYVTNLYKFTGEEEVVAGTSPSWPLESEAKQDAFSTIRFNEVGVRVILVPRTPLEPAFHAFYFSDDAEGWQSFSIPPLDAPAFSTTTGTHGALQMTGTGSTNLVGIWQSPLLGISAMGVESTLQMIVLPAHMTAGPPTFALKYRIRSDEVTPTLVPSFRVRVTATNSQFADVLHIDSNADAAYSPTPEGRDYTLLFQNPFSSPEIRVQFDMLNFDPGDNATATLALDSAIIEGAANLGLSNPRLERVYTFDEGQDGWIPNSLSPTFAEPVLAHDTINGRLGIAAADHDGFQFGFWGSSVDPANNATIEANRLYYGVFTISTNIWEAENVPTFRLRFNESLFRASRYTVVASTGTGAFSPTENAPRDYLLYFPANVGVGQSLLSSYDILVDPYAEGLGPGAAVFLDRVEIFSVPWGEGRSDR